MTTTVTESAPFERTVRFHLEDNRINQAKKGAAQKLAKEVKIHGFRPGKAPLPVIEATVGADRVRQEAIEDLLVQTDLLLQPSQHESFGLTALEAMADL